MSDSSTNLSKSAPKVFENVDPKAEQQVQIPFETIVDPNLTKSLGQDIRSLADQRVAKVEDDLLYSQFVDRIKEFLKTQDSESIIEETKEKIADAKSKIEETSIDKDGLSKVISEIKPEDISSGETEANVKLSDEYVKEVANNILNLINFNSVISSSVEHTVTIVKKLIDANAGEFKKTLEKEMNSKLELSKFKKLNTETGEELIEQPTDSEESDESKEIEAALEEDGEGELVEEAEELPAENEKLAEADAKAEKIPEEKPQDDKKKDDKKDDPLKTLPANQAKVDLKRKETLQEADKNLNDVNQYLKKLIEKKDVVEEYDVRKKTEENPEDKKKKDKDEDDDKKDNDIGKKLGLGLLMGSIFAMLAMFRSNSSHSSLQNYISKHSKDNDGKNVTSDIADESKNANSTISTIGGLLGKGESEMGAADKEIDNQIGEIKEADNQIGDVDDVEGEETPQEATGELPPEDAKVIEESVIAIQETAEELAATAEEMSETSDNIEEAHEAVDQQVPENPEKVEEEIQENVEVDENQFVEDVEAQQEKETPLDDVKNQIEGALEKSHSPEVSETMEEIASDMEKFNDQMDKVGDQVDKQNEQLKEESDQLDKDSKETKEQNDKKTSDIDAAQKKAEEEAKKSQEDTEKQQDGAKKDSEEAKKKTEDIKKQNEENAKNQQESEKKAEEDQKKAEEESQKRAEEQAKQTEEANKENAEKMEQEKEKLSETTAPREELDNANEAAKKTIDDVNESTDELKKKEDEAEQNKEQIDENVEKNIDEQSEEVKAESENVDEMNEELSEKSEELEDNVDKLEEEKEKEEKKDDNKVDDAAKDSLQKDIEKIRFTEQANRDINEVFNEFKDSPESNFDEKFVLVNKESLEKFYAEIKELRNKMTDLVIQESSARGKADIRRRAIDLKTKK